MNATEKRPLRQNGLPDSDPITRKQAQRIAEKVMARDLKRAGFVASVFASDIVIHGAQYWRICYGK